MTAVVLAPGEHDDDDAVPMTLRSEDSFRILAAPVRRLSAAMIVILIGSTAIHGALLVAALITDRTPPPTPVKEIAVEIVRDVPQVPPKAVPRPRPTMPPVEAKATPKPPSPAPASRKPTAADPDAQKRAALEKQLAELQAQQAQLKAEARAQPQPQRPPEPRGDGPLAGSRQALALPAVGIDGEAVDYQSLVFSQLAKAKEVGEYHGEAGTTGVHFEIDADGHLLGEDIAVSSGKATLDAEALAIVRRAAPFPPPPKDAERTFYANVNFIPSRP